VCGAVWWIPVRVKRIPLGHIIPSPYNVRQEIDAESLSLSIGSVGQIEPLRVRPVGEGFEIRTGMRRFLALKQAGVTHVDAIVVEGTDEEVISEQWAENEERVNYTDYERALKLRQMLDALGLTQTELAERIRISRSRIAQLLRMLELENIVTAVTIREMSERHARAILQAPVEDWPDLVQYVELYLAERGEIPSASAIEEYVGELARASEIGKSRRRLLYEIEGEPAPYEGPNEEPVVESIEAPEAYIEEHDLGWVFDVEANGAGFLTKIGMLTNEELEFCLAHETRPLSLQRLNEEADRRDPRPLLKQPPVTASPIIASEEEESMTAEEYVADVLTYNPEVKHSELVKATVEMFDEVSEEYVQGLIDRSRKRGSIDASRSPTTLCPLCGRANAQKNRILIVLEAYEAQPGVTVVEWLKEALA